MVDVWIALADAYGSAFVKQFGDEPSQIWADGLVTFPIDKIEAAIGLLIAQGREFAPNLATVRQALAEIDGTWEHRRMESANNIPALPKPQPLSYAEAQKYINRMKEICNE